MSVTTEYKVNSLSRRRVSLVALSACVLFMSGCMSQQKGYSDQQKRMLRCDQYIGELREECLRGMSVTIEDYKADYREFERDEQKKKDAQNAKTAQAIKESIEKESKKTIKKDPPPLK